MSILPTTVYDEAFFDDIDDGSVASARVVVPLMLKLVAAASVVDFGCGRGSWLKACLDNGVQTVLGLDGDYVKRDRLVIDREQFRAADLSRPIRLDRRFDLAICLELAEHLPARSARILVESLAQAAPVVIFSAALPGQGGTAHINERWPLYWERLFADCGMHKYDVLRPLIWSNRAIEWWYRQNIYLFSTVELDSLKGLERFEPEFSLVSSDVLIKLMFPWRSRTWNQLSKLRRMRPSLVRPSRDSSTSRPPSPPDGLGEQAK
jgi:SAM-dependent methyltransferase